MKIYRLDVSRSKAGKTIPFDRVYLANGEARASVKKLFDYCIVMPVTREFREILTNTYPTTTRHQSDNLKNYWRDLLDSADDWIAVVPILPKQARQLMPSYLANKSWYSRAWTAKERAAKPLLPTLSFLKTPEQIFRPVCVACPRFTEHQAGKCQLGQSVCFTTLVLGDVLPDPEESSVVDPREEIQELLV